MLGRVPGSGGANIGAGPSMSTRTTANALRGQGKALAAAALAGLLMAAAPASKVAAEVNGDFNGDGKVDRAALESARGSWRLVAYLAGLGPKGVFVIDRGRGGPEGLYLELAKPGRYTPTCEEDNPRLCPKAVRVPFTSIDFSGEEGPSQVIYWDGKAFRKIQQGD
jgi:hypothetical protein